MKAKPGIRVLLSSKNPILREGIKNLLKDQPNIHVVGEATTSQQTLRDAARVRPNFVLIDADMAGPATSQAIREMKNADAALKIWVCTLSEDANLIAACLEAGANGSVPSDIGSAKLQSLFGQPTGEKPNQAIRRSATRVHSRVAAMVVLAICAYCSVTAAQEPVPVVPPIGQPDVPAEATRDQKEAESLEEEENKQEEPQNLQGFFFSTPFAAGAVRETRLPIERQSVDDTGVAISFPELTVASVRPRSDFSISYHPTLDRFTNHDELNAVTHRAHLHFAYDIKRRWVLGLKNSFLRTDDPARELRESIFILPRTPYQENVMSMSLDFLKTARTKYTLEATNSFSFLSLKKLAHILPADQFDQVGGALTASVVHKLAAKQRLTNSYSFLLFRELHTGIENSVRSAHNASVLYEYGWDQRGVHLELSGGMLHGSSTSYNALIRAGYNWRNLNVYAGFSRQFAFIRTLSGGFDGFGNVQSALSPESIAEVVTIGLASTLKGSLVVDLAVIAGKGDAAIRGNEIRSLSGRAQIAYRVGRVFPFIGAEYYGQNFNPMMESRMARSRYFAGLAISLSPVTEAANAPAGDYAGKWPLNAPGLAPRRPSKLERGELK